MFFSVSGSCKVNSGTATLSYSITSGWAKLNGEKILFRLIWVYVSDTRLLNFGRSIRQKDLEQTTALMTLM